jgi:IMP dehydrogenase
MPVTQFKELERAYGFDDVSIVPGQVTLNPDLSNIGFSIDGITLTAPVFGAAMDAVYSPAFASELDRLGGLAVMNLEGVHTRYDDPDSVMAEIVDGPEEKVTGLLQRVYSSPIREDLVGARVEEIKSSGAKCAVSVTPASTKRLAPLAVEAGADILLIQSTVTTARHISTSPRGLILSEVLEMINIPVVVGNCVSYDVALELMETGIHGLLIGVGPGATCTTREVTGVGVPQATATLDCAAARDEYKRRTGRYVPIITDGGIRTGGDLCKALACGADGVMIGTPLAQSEEAPGRGFNWGMASPHPALPRGTRIKVGTNGSLEQVLYGPSSRSDGTSNLLGALEVCMGMVGAYTIRDFQEKSKVIIAPSVKTEGKYYQLGME